MIWTYLRGKAKFMNQLCWLCTGLFFGFGFTIFGLGSLLLAFVFDFLSVCLSRKEEEEEL